MPQKTVQPVSTPSPQYKGDTEGVRIDHPAYAMIGASRFTATPGVALFGSDFRHQAAVRITIAKASLSRHGSSEHVSQGDELIEVDLSEAQWARFVSAMNVGFGTSCTLQHVNRERVPQIPDPEDRRTQFAEASAFRAQSVIDSIAEAVAAVQASGLSGKKQKEILDKLQAAEMNAGRNQEYTAEQFSRHMERTVDHAAIEIDAMLTHAVQSAGLEALRSNGPVLAMAEQRLAPEGSSYDLDELTISIRTHNVIHRAGILTIEDLADYSADGLLAVANLGPVALDEVRQALAQHGRHLHGEAS